MPEPRIRDVRVHLSIDDALETAGSVSITNTQLLYLELRNLPVGAQLVHREINWPRRMLRLRFEIPEDAAYVDNDIVVYTPTK